MVFFLLPFGCGNPFCFEVSGPITTWNYHISPFQNIRVYNSPEIFILQGDSQAVTVESEENMFHALLFHIDPFKKLLYIDFDETCIDDIDHFKIFITVDTLKGIDLRGGGEVWVNEQMVTDSMRISISGSADVSIGNLTADIIETDISGSGAVRLYGTDTVGSHQIDISGLGSVYSYGIPVQTTSVTISGGALVQTQTHQALDVSISGTADVYYKGHPTISETITGNGQVIDAN